MAHIASSPSSSTASITLTYTDHLTGRRVPLSLGAGSNSLSPAQLRAQIKGDLALIRAETRLFAHRSPSGYERFRQEPLPPLGHMLDQVSVRLPVRVMFCCLATACQRLAAAPADMHVAYKTMWGWAGFVMERVARGHVHRAQVRQQRRV
jgi:hypothetical protein